LALPVHSAVQKLSNDDDDETTMTADVFFHPCILPSISHSSTDISLTKTVWWNSNSY